ncbi:hypothetical protein FA10DRAFT_285406 [Acaromyces ingoldii]|uniref:Nuclear speckle splicing regulatory protein 1 N-terminal domain-containing protein n=1 Tax=Acaromyces ingoldii TaxID=215250 RepID=A0A316YU07_9BASI|nr:hypothetical protein FA10DRAFT_285406 [Acaromyces ingoldii]PWN92546.1 hypothetical protein FA10DRAFT_285406 [Acaromyces ingoldii]
MASKPKISFGLKKVEAPSKPQPLATASKLSLGDDEDEDDVAKDPSQGPRGSRTGPPASRASKQKQQQAFELDSAVFDYDGVYDRMKAAERETARQKQQDNQKRDPKYMDAFLKSTEDRKRYLARAEAKKIQRERDMEGDEFAGTEAFVTDAYKKQLEEIREQEEKEAREEERRRNKSNGVAGFYRDMLASNDRAHEAAVAATMVEDVAATVETQQQARAEVREEDQQEKDRIKQAVARGSDVRLNDDNEVVDERSLLSAGLNVLSKKKKGEDESRREAALDSKQSSKTAGSSQRDGAREAREAREAQRARQSKLIEAQVLEMEQRKRDEAAKELEQHKKRAVGERRNDAASVASARERALARKRQRMA